jgi:hypothetical protein
MSDLAVGVVHEDQRLEIDCNPVNAAAQGPSLVRQKRLLRIAAHTCTVTPRPGFARRGSFHKPGR